MAELHVKIEDDNGTVEAKIDLFDTEANTNDDVTIYNDANAGGIAIRVYFPGASVLANNPIDVPADSNYATTVSAGNGTYNYIISATLSGGGTVVIDPRFIIGGGEVTR